MNNLLEKLSLVSKEAFDLLKSKGLTLSVAESFTGGLIVSSLIKYEGASSVVKEGIVCYTHEAKRLRLGVKSSTIEQFSAVSKEVADEMLEGILRSSLNPDCAIVTTGNAGPGVEKNSKRGDTYIAVFAKGQKFLINKVIYGTREENILLGAIIAFETLIEIVKKI